jgi:hypothetical protein
MPMLAAACIVRSMARLPLIVLTVPDRRCRSGGMCAANLVQSGARSWTFADLDMGGAHRRPKTSDARARMS